MHRASRPARFFLDVDRQPASALAAARENWRAQREPDDILILLRAARAAHQPQAAADALEFLRRTGLEDFIFDVFRGPIWRVPLFGQFGGTPGRAHVGVFGARTCREQWLSGRARDGKGHQPDDWRSRSVTWDYPAVGIDADRARRGRSGEFPAGRATGEASELKEDLASIVATQPLRSDLLRAASSQRPGGWELCLVAVRGALASRQSKTSASTIP